MSSNKKKSNNQLWENDIEHLVLQPAAAAVLEQSFEINDSIKGDVVSIKEDYSVGSVRNLSEADGWQQRKEFWKELQSREVAESEESDALQYMQQDRLALHTLKKKLYENENLHVWIWMGQNERDVCGYYWLITQLREFESRVYVLYLNNLPFISDRGNIFYPVQLTEIPPKELVKARRLSRPVSLAEIELDGDEWKRLCEENARIRILEGGKKITSQPDNYFDKMLVNTIGGDTYKLPRLLNQLFTKHKTDKPELFWKWRLKHLIDTNVLVENGDWTKTKDLSFRKNSGSLFEQFSEEENG